MFLLFAILQLLAPAPCRAYEDTLTTENIQGTLEDTKLNEVFSQYLATIQMYDPERATRMGLHDADTSLTQRTPERVARELEALKRLRAKMAVIQKDTMPAALQVDYTTLDHMLEVDIYEMENLGVLARRPQYYLEPLFLVYEMMNKDYDDYNTRASNAISRLKQFPGILQQAERNLSHPPAAWTRQAIKQTNDALDSFVSDSAQVFRGYASYDPVLKTSVDDTMDKVKTALARYSAFLKTDILPNSDGDPRCGEFTYGFYLERWHGLDMTPGGAYRYSKKAFKNSIKDLNKQAQNIDALLAREKGWKGVLDKLPKDHPEQNGVLKSFQD
jgi:uncharacterized protein YukE